MARRVLNVDGRSQWETGRRDTDVRLNGSCEGGLM